jgi:hypothetical protein
MKPQRYFLSQDNSSHWYLVPVENREEWDAWCNLDEDDEAAWDAPDFARRLDGGPNGITFSDPVED